LLVPTLGLIATILGVALGGYVAGKWANSAGLQHGVMVGVGYIVFEAVGLAPTVSYASDVVADTAIVIALDVVTLLAASFAGWLATRGLSSSSDTGRAP
jgi:uncharacterized membrane protein AbrB (regulator of aidB expression)